MLSQGFHQTYLSNDPLPIVLLSFEANRSEAGTEVLLRWTTLREWNNAYFTIERSIDGKDFSPLFEIEAAGSSNRPINYTATDNRALPCASYYRLRQTDFDGSTSLSEPVVIPALNMNEGLRVTVFPNPAGEETTLLLNAGPGAHEVELRDAQGRYIRTESFEGNRKRLSLMGLSGGVYVLRLRDNRGEMKYLRILKQD
jgi:hypothetical protein